MRNSKTRIDWVLIKDSLKQPSKTQLSKYNELISYMFRPYGGHLQADIRNILGSIRIICGSEISLLTGFYHKSRLYIEFDFAIEIED
jgi:hypothetical protein